MNVVIKEVSQEDWKQIINIGVQTNEADIVPTLSPDGQAAMRSRRESDIRKILANPNSKVLKAEASGQIVGYIACGGGYYIAQLYVLPKFQGLGIGSKLVASIKSIAKAESLELKASLNAVSFYKSLGFKQTAQARSSNGIIFVPMELSIEIECRAPRGLDNKE